MCSDIGQSKKDASVSEFIVYVITGLCVLLPLILPACRKRPETTKPSPPDLSSCTRIEFLYHPSPIEYFVPLVVNHDLLSQEEKKDLKSKEPIVVDDPEVIKALAHDVSLGKYSGPNVGSIARKDCIYFDCYRNGEHITSFMQIGNTLIT